MKSTERLEELLNKKDAEIDGLQTELHKYQDEEERSEWRWTFHSETKNGEGLPVPRLEIRCDKVRDTWHNWVWKYALIYKHFTGEFIVVPMGQTQVGGGRNAPPIRDGELDLPFRDGVHITHEAETLGLPAFALCDGIIKELEASAEKRTWKTWKAKSV